MASRQLPLTEPLEPVVTVGDGRISIHIDRTAGTINVTTKGPLTMNSSTCLAFVAGLQMARERLKKR